MRSIKHLFIIPSLFAFALCACQSTKFAEVEVPTPPHPYPPATIVFGSENNYGGRIQLNDIEKLILDELRKSRVFQHVFHDNRNAPVKLQVDYDFELVDGDGESLGKALVFASSLGMVPVSRPYKASFTAYVLGDGEGKQYHYEVEGKEIISLAHTEFEWKMFQAMIRQFLSDAIHDRVFEVAATVE